MRRSSLSLALLSLALLVAPAAAQAASNPWLERRVLNIAHQGGEHEAPSNTMFAYKTALEKGADVLEMDVQLTADGEIVVFHDRTVDGRTNGTGAVNDLTLAQIKELDAADNWIQYRGIATGAGPNSAPPGFTADDFKIPTLAEVLEQYPDQLINIEIKGLAPDSTDPGWETGQADGKNQALETAVALAALLREYRRDDDVIVVSFSEMALQRFKAEAPEIHTAAGLESAAAFYGSSVEALPGAPNPEHVALQVPEYFEAGNGAPPIHVVTQDFVDNAHANGLAVHVWLNGHPTENKETYDRLVALGVDGIMTDQPTRLEQNFRDAGIAEDGPRPFHVFGCEEQGTGVRFCQGTLNSRVRTFDGVPLDVNVALPPKPAEGPDGDYPLIIQLHGWGGSKSGLGSMSRWAEAGYAVLNYTARGFGNSCGSAASRQADPVGCAEGWIRLADSRFEARDSQFLAGMLADQGLIDPQRIGAMGGSYGGGQSMHLAVLRDRVRLPDGTYTPWVSEKREIPMRIAGAVPTVPWTDLVYSLMPNGRTRDYTVAGEQDSRAPLGVMKASYVSGLFAAGAAAGYYAPPGADPDADLTTWYARVAAGEPYDDPLAKDIADEIATNHSPYYLDMDRPPAPTLISNGFTDDLFPVDEAVRFANKVEQLHPDARVSQLHFDYGHARGQGKDEDEAVLAARTREWMDRYVKGDESVEPLSGVEAMTQTCGEKSGGPYHAPDWHSLSPGEVRYGDASAKTVLAGSDDPQLNQRVDPITGGGACVEVGSVDSDGDAVYRLPAAEGDGYTLLGSATVIADMEVQGGGAALVARLWDVSPEGPMTLVARALYRPDPLGRQVFQLHPNGWHFKAGHVPRLELLGQDAPYARPSNSPWALAVSNLELRLPVAEEPDCEQVLSPLAPVFPEGATPAPGVDAEPRDLCSLEDPVASFDFAPSAPRPGETVEFTSTSTDPDGEVVTVAWDLDGDGEHDDATGPTAQHAFTDPGEYTIGLSAIDNDDRTATVTRQVVVAAAPEPVPPTASFDFAPAEPRAGDTVTFTSASGDPDGEIAGEAWDLDGDGEYDDATGATAERSFAEAGEYTVGLSVTDDEGSSTSVRRQVVVAAAPTGGGETGGGGTGGGDTDGGDTDGSQTDGGEGEAPATGTPGTPEPVQRPADPSTESQPQASTPPPPLPPPPAVVKLSAPRLASDEARGPRVTLRLEPRGTTPTNHFEVQVRTAGSTRFKRLTSNLPVSRRTYRFDGAYGTTYEFRARAVGIDGRAGPWDRARSIVPFDDFRRLPDYARDSWTLARTRGAFGGRVTRSTDAGAELTLRFRGKRLHLIGRRSPRGGRAVAILDGERRRIGFRARRVRERAVIARWRLKPGRHRLRLVHRGGGRVEIDGFGVDRG